MSRLRMACDAFCAVIGVITLMFTGYLMASWGEVPLWAKALFLCASLVWAAGFVVSYIALDEL